MKDSTLLSQGLISKLMPHCIFQRVPPVWQAASLWLVQCEVGLVDPIVTCPPLYLLCHKLGVLVLGDVMWDPMLANQVLEIFGQVKKDRLMWNVCQPQSG